MLIQATDNPGRKKYQCPCGRSFSRRSVHICLSAQSDVLLRHMRTCQHGQNSPENRLGALEKQSRTKKACNSCARSKVKCNAQNPCQRCTAKSLVCEYTRPGYLDRYEAFQILDGATIVDPASSDVQSGSVPAGHLLDSRQDEDRSLVAVPCNELSISVTGTSLLGVDQINNLSSAPHQAGVSAIGDYINAPFLQSYGPGVLDISLEEDWDSIFALPESLDALDYSYGLPMAAERIEFNQNLDQPKWQYSAGLQLHQIDGVEGKCVEIRDFLRSIQTSIPLDPILNYVTRDRLVSGIQFYGRHYQPIQPMLHLPTFELTKTPATLLLAMMLVGACYSSNDNPAATIVQCAIHSLHIMERSLHETTMAAPPIASIQANTLLCQLLICTKDPTAYKFATMHRARTFSMAERAGLFEASQNIDYQAMTANTFNWTSWIESEMRRRLAYHIFVDDIGGSIFTRSSSHISPFTFYVDTPCYENCWVAPTASECLKALQNMPRQPQLAAALRSLRSAKPDGHFLFDASDCGMLQIIIALHHVLFRAMEESLEYEDNAPQDPASSSNSSTLSHLLQRNLLNHDIANIANEFVAKYGSSGIRRANDTLDAWRRNWDLRKVHDIYGGDESSAFSHPLNFWLLAKLFVVVHFFRNHFASNSVTIGGEQEQGQRGHTNIHAFFGANDGSASARIKIQLQVIDWLAQIRQQQHGQPLSAESFLSQVINSQ